MENIFPEVRASRHAWFDPAEAPAYSVAQVARCLDVPETTLNYWLSPRTGPLVIAPEPRPQTLCFKNLVECHVLRALRIEFGLSMRAIRHGVRTLREKWNTRYPLADKELSSDRISLFLQEKDRLYDVSRFGAQAFPEMIAPYLKRIDRDANGVAKRFFPIIKFGPAIETEPHYIVVDPNVCFGRPVINGTRISTAVIAGRYQSGEGLKKLATQYGRSQEEIKAAVKLEARRRAS